jgi:hypothetical protein
MQGISNLELICAEFEALNELQVERKRIKKERKKQRKLMNKQSDQNTISNGKIDDEQTTTVDLTNKENIDEENNIEKIYTSQVDINNNNTNDMINDKTDDQNDKETIISNNDTNERSCKCNNNTSSSDHFFQPFYSTLLNDINDNNNQDDSIMMITEEEKNEYYANKAMYLIERINRREMLKEKFQNLKMNSCLKIRPRNFS